VKRDSLTLIFNISCSTTHYYNIFCKCWTTWHWNGKDIQSSRIRLLIFIVKLNKLNRNAEYSSTFQILVKLSYNRLYNTAPYLSSRLTPPSN